MTVRVECVMNIAHADFVISNLSKAVLLAQNIALRCVGTSANRSQARQQTELQTMRCWLKGMDQCPVSVCQALVGLHPGRSVAQHAHKFIGASSAARSGCVTSLDLGWPCTHVLSWLHIRHFLQSWVGMAKSAFPVTVRCCSQLLRRLAGDPQPLPVHGRYSMVSFRLLFPCFSWLVSERQSSLLELSDLPIIKRQHQNYTQV